MILSTVTNMFLKREGGSFIPLEESMRRLREIGFTTLDISLQESILQPNHPLITETWEHWVNHIGEEAANLGITLSSAHLPYFQSPDPRFKDTDKQALVEKAMHRSVQACEKLGIKWAAAHITHSVEDAGFVPEIKKKSIRYFTPFIEAANLVGVGIAFENMIASNEINRIRYPAAAWELIDFVDDINAPNVGICWDFGHAHFLYPNDQSKPLHQLGKRLKVIHVHDNWRTADSHVTPYFGTINWPPIMEALTDMGFAGDFTLELTTINRGRPDEVQTMNAQHAYLIGMYLLAMADKSEISRPAM